MPSLSESSPEFWQQYRSLATIVKVHGSKKQHFVVSVERLGDPYDAPSYQAKTTVCGRPYQSLAAPDGGQHCGVCLRGVTDAIAVARRDIESR